MIYISIDNDHHANLALFLVNNYNIPLVEVKIISHISPRNTIISDSGINYQPVEIHPLCAGSSYKNPLTYVKSIFHQLKIKRLFNFTSSDILIVTTEYELNNALFAKEMHRSGGKVYLLDEGIGFYFNNSPYHNTRTKRINKIYLSLYNVAFKVMGIPAHAKKGQEGRMFACISDVLINKIYSSMNLPISRQIPIDGYRSMLISATPCSQLKRGVAIVFATNFECFDLKKEEMHLAELAIERMASIFSEVYIKVHPSDYIAQNDVFNFYRSLKYKNVRLVDNSLTAVQAIIQYRPAVVVGTMSTSLFDAMFLGCQPIFLFHLLPKIPEFGVYKFTLDNLRYKFIPSLSDITPSYQCNVDITNLTYDNKHLDFTCSEINNEQEMANGNAIS
jgi:hypothetical protein